MKRLTKAIISSFLLISVFVIPVSAIDYTRVDVGYQVKTTEWTDYSWGGALGGSEGGAALTALKMNLDDASYGAGIEYRVYTGSTWSDWAQSFQEAGNGQAILGVQIQLKDFDHANVYYQTYRSGLGWGTWVKNGQTSGTLDSASPITGIRVKVDEVGVEYQSNVGGTLQVVRHNRETQGSGLIYTIQMGLISSNTDDKIEYRAYFKNTGWTNWVANYTNLGSERSGDMITALEAKLVGLDGYHVAIQPQVNGTWWDWAYDGATAGTLDTALTAYRVKIEKDAPKETVATPVVVEEEPVVEEEAQEESSGELKPNESSELSKVSVYGWAFPAIGDVNGDGFKDVIVGSFDGTVQTYYQTSLGKFEQQTDEKNPFKLVEAPTFSEEYSLRYSFPTLGDFDNDGDLDLVLGYGDMDSKEAGLYLYENTGSSTNPQFTSLTDNNFLNVDRGTYSFLTSGDYDGDGDDDLFLGSSFEGENNSEYLKIVKNSGEKRILSSADILDNHPFDFDNEIGENGNSITEEAYLQFATIPYLGDFNGDGVIDFAAGSLLVNDDISLLVFHTGANVDGSISYTYHSNYNQLISPFNEISFSVPFATAGDLDNDGDADFLIGDGNDDGVGFIQYYENQ